MDEPENELDIAALFEAEPLHGERFSIYVPNKDRNGTLISQEPWVEEALALLSKIGGGATATGAGSTSASRRSSWIRTPARSWRRS